MIIRFFWVFMKFNKKKVKITDFVFRTDSSDAYLIGLIVLMHKSLLIFLLIYVGVNFKNIFIFFSFSIFFWFANTVAPIWRNYAMT